jgi:hypothetical protein
MGAVAELRERLAERYPQTLPLAYRTAQGVGTGIGKLDGLLPNGGFPRGRLTVWRPGGGATAVLREASRNTVERGERAAWVDPGGQVMGEFWPQGPLLLRPSGESAAVECVEELARCGGFGLIVLGSGEIKGNLAIRLGRAVRTGGGALVLITRDTEQAQLRLESRLLLSGFHWSVDPFGNPADLRLVTLRVQAWSMGWSGRTELRANLRSHGHRNATEPTLPDRRGVRRWARP